MAGPWAAHTGAQGDAVCPMGMSKHGLAGCGGAQLMSARLFICAQKCNGRWGKGTEAGGNSLMPKHKQHCTSTLIRHKGL